MKIVTPRAIIVGETAIVPDGLKEFLEAIGTPEWSTDAQSDSEVIVEVAGKLCYMSFGTELNRNLTRVGTRNNHDYIQKGLIETKHGSVLEHVAINIAFLNVSRVLTHELIRHRPGAAYSQTSGRYVRTDELAFWIPSCIKSDPTLESIFIEAVENQERSIKLMEEYTGIDKMTDFSKKKELTSAFRRIAGFGHASNIMATYNHRALRHLLEVRTHESAEEEIRLTFASLFQNLIDRYPAIYSDAESEMVKGIEKITFRTNKV